MENTKHIKSEKPWWWEGYVLSKKAKNIKPEVLKAEKEMSETDFINLINGQFEKSPSYFFLKPGPPSYKGEWKGYEEEGHDCGACV